MSNNSNLLSILKIGDSVWHPAHGRGQVIELGIRLIRVEYFLTNTFYRESYSPEGYLRTEDDLTLATKPLIYPHPVQIADTRRKK